MRSTLDVRVASDHHRPLTDSETCTYMHARRPLSLPCLYDAQAAPREHDAIPTGRSLRSCRSSSRRACSRACSRAGGARRPTSHRCRPHAACSCCATSDTPWYCCRCRRRRKQQRQQRQGKQQQRRRRRRRQQQQPPSRRAVAPLFAPVDGDDRTRAEPAGGMAGGGGKGGLRVTGCPHAGGGPNLGTPNRGRGDRAPSQRSRRAALAARAVGEFAGGGQRPVRDARTRCVVLRRRSPPAPPQA